MENSGGTRASRACSTRFPGNITNFPSMNLVPHLRPFSGLTNLCTLSETFWSFKVRI
jgi:hypothetical protein